MKRVTAFVGSARKKSTYSAVCQFLDNLKSLGDIEYEIVALSDQRLGTCRGCQLCFDKGEKFCPLKDDWDVLWDCGVRTPDILNRPCDPILLPVFIRICGETLYSLMKKGGGSP